MNMPKALYLNWHLLMHKVLQGLGGKMVRAAGLAACCNYFSKKKKIVYEYVLNLSKTIYEYHSLAPPSQNS